MKWGFIGVLLVLCVGVAEAVVTVTGIDVVQRSDTKLADIYYDLDSSYTNSASVEFQVLDGTNELSATTFSGDIGENVSTGISKHVVWNMEQDWDEQFSTNIIIKILAVDAMEGGDTNAESWIVLNDQWVRNIYSNGDMTMTDRQNNRMWPYSGKACAYGYTSWYSATSKAGSFVYASYDDWYVPSGEKLTTVSGSRNYFIDWYFIGGTGYPVGYFFWTSEYNNPFSAYGILFIYKDYMNYQNVDPSLAAENSSVFPCRDIEYVDPQGQSIVCFLDSRDEPTYWLDVSVQGAGTVDPESGLYDGGTNLSLYATGSNDWLFVGWSGDMVGDYTSVSTNIIIDRPKLIVAHFSEDADSDGLLNSEEVVLGTNPRSGDSDGDGLSDPDEVSTYLTNPSDSDSDNDGLSDGQEILTYGTNPNLKDSDYDGFNDGFEVATGFNPAVGSSSPDLLSEIQTAIELKFNAANGVIYGIEATDSLSNIWYVIESGIIGQGDVVKRLYSIEGQPNRFFRARRN